MHARSMRHTRCPWVRAPADMFEIPAVLLGRLVNAIIPMRARARFSIGRGKTPGRCVCAVAERACEETDEDANGRAQRQTIFLRHCPNSLQRPFANARNA